MDNQQFPSHAMTSDITLLAFVSQFVARCAFMDEDDITKLEPLMVHFGFTEKQREVIAQLMRVSMEDRT
jgi:hypothetical protein